MTKLSSQRYRCTYSPLDINGYSLASESGVLPFIDVHAESAEHAARLAHSNKGAPIVDVMRLDDAAPRATRKARRLRPVIQLITGAELLAAQLRKVTP
jgi:hypothetical protein